MFSPAAASDEVTDDAELDSSKDLRDVFGSFIIEVNADATGHFEYKSRKKLENHERLINYIINGLHLRMLSKLEKNGLVRTNKGI